MRWSGTGRDDTQTLSVLIANKGRDPEFSDTRMDMERSDLKFRDKVLPVAAAGVNRSYVTT